MVSGLTAEVQALAHYRPPELRALIRRGDWMGQTEGLAVGYTQANLVVVPLEYAFEFLLFCQRNPKPSPVLEVMDPGSPEPRQLAPGADVRTDLTKYCVFQEGRLIAEPSDIVEYWRSDLVAFLIGCGMTFVGALLRANVPVRNSSMYVTTIACTPAGRFAGPLIVMGKPVPHDKVVRVVQVTSRFPNTHGAPVHIGDPAALGIADLAQPCHGDPMHLDPGDVPVFWACGITFQAVALAAKVPFMITQAPSHMFITDQLDEEAAVF